MTRHTLPGENNIWIDERKGKRNNIYAKGLKKNYDLCKDRKKRQRWRSATINIDIKNVNIKNRPYIFWIKILPLDSLISVTIGLQKPALNNFRTIENERYDSRKGLRKCKEKYMMKISKIRKQI